MSKISRRTRFVGTTSNGITSSRWEDQINSLILKLFFILFCILIYACEVPALGGQEVQTNFTYEFPNLGTPNILLVGCPKRAILQRQANMCRAYVGLYKPILDIHETFWQEGLHEIHRIYPIMVLLKEKFTLIFFFFYRNPFGAFGKICMNGKESVHWMRECMS